MTLQGMIQKILRSINTWIMRLFRWIKGGLTDEEEAGEEVPRKWIRKAQLEDSRPNSKTELKMKKGKVLAVRKVYHVPMLRTIKRGLAGILLFLNFVFSQFLIATQSQGILFSLLFFGNTFIFIDYLWKTRRQMS